MNEFLIDHIDPLGQGVHKEDESIFFIPKTLPGESGTFKILQRKKGVHFATALEVTKTSDIRINPECIHFNECPGCQYLHTSYENELNLKKEAFHRTFKKLIYNKDALSTIYSDNRHQYRNRIQLHYDRSIPVIGFNDARKKRIVPVPNCIIMNDRVQKFYQELLGSWLEESSSHPTKGHVEIYDHKGKVHINWNKSYAATGFSQVNIPVNQLMLKEINSLFPNKLAQIVDLFAGAGNITNALNFEKRICLDIYPHTENPEEFINTDLYNSETLPKFLKNLNSQVELLVLDPPRSGFKELNMWINALKPKNILYISCSPGTLARDLALIETRFEVQNLALIDLFPGTHHFEVMTHIKTSF